MEKEAREADPKKMTSGITSGGLQDSSEPLYETLLKSNGLTFEVYPLFKRPDDHTDFANTVAIDQQNKWRVAVGSEKGKMIVFNLKSKLIEAVFKGDIWVNSLEIRGTTIFAVGSQKSIEAFNYRSQNKIFKLPSYTKDYEGFGSKGILVKNIRKSNLLICNVGYSMLVIIDRHTRKILKRINFCSGKLGKDIVDPSSKRSAVLNHHLIQENNILILLFRGDSNLYFFDLKRMTLVKRVKLFNFEELPSDMFVMNTEIVSHGGSYVAVILQFSYNKRKRNLNKTIFYFFDVKTDSSGSEAKINFSFYDAIPLGKDVFISCDIIQLKPDHEVAPMRSVGYLILLGTSQGDFVTQTICTVSKTCSMTPWLKWKTNTEVTGLVRRCESSCYYLTADGNLTHIGWTNDSK